ncbi:hypothetical protein [Cupriavidus basilensis]|uniref:Uncharacterized protein n=1 Tax=Cupriavidus basilensis TaxID=68895 RepID=A0A0C4YFC4_9BURK|nr:hypothetical protein [Cupriavidus basilensis]AJG24502.1 hypothetical protein RR42_s2921 [Cupriavidus basilensis]
MESHQLTVRHTLRIDQWMTAVGNGETSLEYDNWLSCVLNDLEPGRPEYAISITTREGKNEFRFQHRARYEVRHPKYGIRRFVCAVDSDATLIAFENTISGVRYPWVTIDGTFTQAELWSLRLLCAGVDLCAAPVGVESR